MPQPPAPERSSASRTFWLPLLLITAGGALLRVWGLGFGLPLDLRPDEDVFRKVVADMLAQGDMDPRWYFYPGLPFHLLLGALALVHGLAGLLGLPAGDSSLLQCAQDPVLVTWVQRGLSAAWGSLTVPLLAILGRRLGGRGLGLSAALILAILPLHVRDSHFGTADVLCATLVTAALLLCTRAAVRGTLASFALAGAAAGVATASRYLPALLALSLLAANVATCRRERAAPWRLAAGPRLLAAGGCMLAAFLACAPYTLLNWPAFSEAMLNLRAMSATPEGAPLLPSLQSFWQHTLLDGMTWPLVLAAGAGLLIAAWSPGPGWTVVLVYGLAHTTLLVTSNLQFVRYGLVLTPLVALLAAHAACVISARAPVRWRPIACAAALALLGLLPLARTLGHVRLLARPTTFQELAAWMAHDLPAGSVLASTSGEVVRITRPACRLLTGWDPVRIAAQDDAWLVVATHPHPAFGPGASLDALLQAFDHRDVVFATTALASDAWKKSTWEAADAFYFPLAGTRHVLRGGPDLRVIHVRGRRDVTPARRPGQAPANLRIERIPRGLRVAWDPVASPAVAGWYLRIAPRELVDQGSLPKPIALPPGRPWLVITDPPAGRYLASVSAVGVAGEGPWSEILSFAVGR